MSDITAEKHYRISAKNNYPTAQYALSKLYENDYGVQQDNKQAVN